MILFFYGDDTYRSKQKIKELKTKFIHASLGDTNLSMLDGKSTPYEEMVRQILAMPFLAKSRLVIIENLLKEGKKEVIDKMVEFLPKVPESTVLVFAEEGIPDKRTSLFKKLNQPKRAQEFAPLDDAQIRRWTKKEVEERGAEIEPEAMTKLVEYVGVDLWRLSNELDKLVNYKKKITVDNIELLVKSQTQSDVFMLIDALAGKRREVALKELHKLLDDGQNELYIFSMIVYQYRNLLIVRDFIDRGVNSQWDIAKKAKIHPYVAGKTLQQARNYSFDELKNIYHSLMENDLALKTGQIEPKTALDLLVLKLSSI